MRGELFFSKINKYSFQGARPNYGATVVVGIRFFELVVYGIVRTRLVILVIPFREGGSIERVGNLCNHRDLGFQEIKISKY